MTTTDWMRGDVLVADDLDAAFGRCVDRAGDTMTGVLTLSADPTVAMNAATKQYVDNHTSAIAQGFLPIGGGTLTGPLILAGDPTQLLGAATKQYVDTHIPSGGGGAGSVTISDTPPASPTAGAMWWDSVGGQLYIWFTDPNSNQWVIANSTGGAASITVSDTPPGNPVNGQMWFDSVGLQTYVWYVDPNSQQWVSMNNQSGNIGEAPTDGSVYGRRGSTASWIGVVQKAGDTMTGNLTISSAADTVIFENTSTSGHNHALISQVAGSARWNVNFGTGEAETGSNAGSNFLIARYADNGAFIDNPLYINRANGQVTFSQPANLLSGSVVTTVANGGQLVYNGARVWAAGAQSDGRFTFWDQTSTNIPLSLTYDGVHCLQPLSIHGSTPVTDFLLWEGSNNRYIQFGANWAFLWAAASGDFDLNNPSGLFFSWRNSDKLSFNAQGTVAGYGAYVNLSDARSKVDVVDADAGLDEVLRLKPISFHRIMQDGTVADHSELGFTAQDVQSVLPEAVRPLGMKLHDGSGELDSDAPSLGVSIDPIVAALVNAVKTLTARVAELEAARA